MQQAIMLDLFHRSDEGEVMGQYLMTDIEIFEDGEWRDWDDAPEFHAEKVYALNDILQMYAEIVGQCVSIDTDFREHGHPYHGGPCDWPPAPLHVPPGLSDEKLAAWRHQDLHNYGNNGPRWWLTLDQLLQIDPQLMVAPSNHAERGARRVPLNERAGYWFDQLHHLETAAGDRPVRVIFEIDP